LFLLSGETHAADDLGNYPEDFIHPRRNTGPGVRAGGLLPNLAATG
jgi:hypothetical protein